MTVGDIYWVELPPTIGHEQSGRRPAVIVQDEAYASQLPMVLAIPPADIQHDAALISISSTSSCATSRQSLA